MWRTHFCVLAQTQQTGQALLVVTIVRSIRPQAVVSTVIPGQVIRGLIPVVGRLLSTPASAYRTLAAGQKYNHIDGRSSVSRPFRTERPLKIVEPVPEQYSRCFGLKLRVSNKA